MPSREQFCDNCGGFLGVFHREAHEYIACSAAVCREAERQHHRALLSDAEERAEAYGFLPPPPPPPEGAA
jgi:hypothetical protein